jgi:hypothetical protein
MGPTTELRRAVEAVLLPLTAAAGFHADRRGMPRILAFRRAAGERVQILEIQWDGYGRPRFVVNFGTCLAEGLNIDGRRFPPEEVAAGWLADGGRLQPRRGAGSGAWFRQDAGRLWRLLGQEAPRPAASVAAELVALLPEVLRHFEGEPPGPHMRPRG